MVCASLLIFSNRAGSFPPQSFFISNDHNIYPNELTLIIYLAALAGPYLDILFRGVNLLTDNHNNIVSGSRYTHIIDELNIVWACLFTNIQSI